MSMINLSNEGLELVNQICDAGNLSERIILLEGIEQSLQEMAVSETDDLTKGYNLYDMAFSAKRMRQELQKLRAAVAGCSVDEDE